MYDTLLGAGENVWEELGLLSYVMQTIPLRWNILVTYTIVYGYAEHSIRIQQSRQVSQVKKIFAILHVEPSEFYGVIKPVTAGADSDLLAIDLTDML